MICALYVRASNIIIYRCRRSYLLEQCTTRTHVLRKMEGVQLEAKFHIKRTRMMRLRRPTLKKIEYTNSTSIHPFRMRIRDYRSEFHFDLVMCAKMLAGIPVSLIPEM